MPRLNFRRQQTKRCDQRKIDIVLHADELRSALRIYFCNRRVIARIEFDNVRLFVNDLRLVIAHLVDLMGDFFVARLRNHHPDQLFTAESHSIALDPLRRPPLIGERIERKIDILFCVGGDSRLGCSRRKIS